MSKSNYFSVGEFEKHSGLNLSPGEYAFRDAVTASDREKKTVTVRPDIYERIKHKSSADMTFLNGEETNVY